MATIYNLYHAKGTHRDLGRQHGEQCREQLMAFVDFIGRSLHFAKQQLHETAFRFQPLFQSHCPHLLDEIQGLAEGAGVSFAEALAVQLRGELAGVQGEACTTFVIAGHGTADGNVLIGQNSDMDPEFEELGYMLHLSPLDKPPLLMWTFGGQIGYHGVNTAGVAHFANALGGGPAWKFGLSHYPIKRMMLEYRTIAGVLEMLRKTPVCSNGNYVICDGDGRIADIELTSEGFEVFEDDGDGFIAHTNHFLCSPHACADNDSVSVPDSFPRLHRMKELIRSKFGSITVDDMKQFLSDHTGRPTSICRHPHDGPDHPSVSARGYTAASLIAEPAAGRMHVCRGNPCAGEYAMFRLD